MRISDWSSDVCSSDLVLLRDLARSGRLARLRLRLQDRPGALFQIARIFDEQQVNIIEIYHQRVFTTLPAKGLITDIECETRDHAPLDRPVDALARGGHEATKRSERRQFGTEGDRTGRSW